MSPEPPELTYGTFSGFAYMQYIRNDNDTLCVLLFMLRRQEVGGPAQINQDAIAQELEMDPAQVSKAIAKLKKLGLASSRERGTIQLQAAESGRMALPDASLPEPSLKTCKRKLAEKKTEA
ncbi:hypothetical protein [Streptomyces sp. NPDC085665]|uniref:hypothetical protein n=1 Tax=Streptomyces sp. NPDC085665 TaxID=3365735 RepID=UPI0037D8B836